MLTPTQLVQQITSTIGKPKVIELSKILKEQQFALHDLIDITFNEDQKIAFRAAWLLENIYLQHSELYLNDLEYLLKRFEAVKYPSCQRHYAKIIMHITSSKAPDEIKLQLYKTALNPIIEKLFDWMIDPKIKIAVKVFSSEALFNIRGSYSWISDELANQIQFLMRDGTAAIQSRGRKILKQLGN